MQQLQWELSVSWGRMMRIVARATIEECMLEMQVSHTGGGVLQVDSFTAVRYGPWPPTVIVGRLIQLSLTWNFTVVPAVSSHTHTGAQDAAGKGSLGGRAGWGGGRCSCCCWQQWPAAAGWSNGCEGRRYQAADGPGITLGSPHFTRPHSHLA
jgi:hypothetical protein